MGYKYIDMEALEGKTLAMICKVGADRIHMEMADRTKYAILHNQECFESVSIYDIEGDLASLVGSPLIVANKETSKEWPKDVEAEEDAESFTWTTIHLATEHAAVSIRWLGESNGYYGEGVDLEEV